MRPTQTICLVTLLALGAAGCKATGPIDDTSAAAILIVTGINATSAPFGDIISDTGTVRDDTVNVAFAARLKNPTDLTGPTLQDIVIERYEVTFSRTDGGTAVPAGFTRAMNVQVRLTPHQQQNQLLTQVGLVLLPSGSKLQPPLSHLIDPGFEPGTGFLNIQVTATMRFFGRTIAGDPVSAEAAIGIDLTDFAG